MKSFNCLFLLLLLPFLSIAQTREYTWVDTNPSLATIPAEYGKHNAVITFHKQRYSLDEKWDLYYTVHLRVRLLTTKGLEDYARIILPNSTSESTIHTLDARTIKKNGTIVDLKQSDIKKLDIPVDDYANKAEMKIFSIPGAEVGDEIEMIYVIKNGHFFPIIYLQQELPVLQSTYELRLPKMIFMDIMSYNGMVKPVIQEKTDVTTYSWQMNNLPGYGNDENSIKALTIPYIFQAYKQAEINMMTNGIKAGNTKWSDILRRWKERVKLEDKLSLKYNSLYNDFIANATKGIAPKDTLLRIIAIHDHLNKHFKIGYVNPEESLPLASYLEKGIISDYLLICLYIKIFQDQGVPYSMVLAKNKYLGPIDLTVPDMMQVSDYLFAVKDGAGNMYLLTPRTDDQTYEAAELPINIQGTSAIIIDGLSYNEGSIRLPIIDMADNNRLRKVQVQVNLTDGSVKKSIQENLTGSYSSFIRPSYIEPAATGKLKDYLQYLNTQRSLYDRVDSISIAGPKQDYPYDFKLNYTMTQNKAVAPFEDGLYQLSFANWMFHNVEEPGEGERTLAYYPICARKDQFKYYLVFDKKIELVNGDNLKVQVVHPEHGAYDLTVKQVNPTVILIESNYIVSGKEFTAEEIGKLNEINDAWKQASQTPLIFKIL